MRTLVLLCVAAGLAGAQDLKKNSGGAAPAAKGAVDQKAVDAAISRGAAWLQKQRGTVDDLVLLTLAHAGIEDKELLGRVLAMPLTRTYNVAIQAMALEKIDRVKHQPRIAQCAQFLVDSMGSDGMWTYGGEAGRVGAPTGGKGGDVPTGPLKKPTEKREDVATGGDAKAEPKKEPEKKDEAAPVKRIKITKQRNGPGGGDHSNTQYAALGLRACHDAGIDLPAEVIEKAAKQWRNSRARDGGWDYTQAGRGPSTGSMTTAGVASLIIYDHILGQDWKQDADVVGGIEWLAANFSVEKNPGGGGWHLYYLYGLERVGMLFGTETIGKREWYREGAGFLLRRQGADGSWNATVWYDTCFAILFLKRATKSLDEPKPQPKPKKPEEPARPDVATGGDKKR
jgi:hypothetical protein